MFLEPFEFVESELLVESEGSVEAGLEEIRVFERQLYDHPLFETQNSYSHTPVLERE